MSRSYIGAMLLLTIGALPFAACTGDEPEASYIVLSDYDPLTLLPDGGYHRIGYEVLGACDPGHLRVVADQSWIHSFETQNSSAIGFRADANRSGSERSAVIRISHPGAEAQTIPVRQLSVYPDPEDAVVQNMVNADFGATELHETDVYITADNQFASRESNFRILDLGAVSGLGEIREFVSEGGVSACGVVSGHGYILYGNPREFPSGATAYYLDWSYRVYVSSLIVEDGRTIGAVIHYQSPFTTVNLPLSYEAFVAADPDRMGWEVYEDHYKGSVSYYIRKENQFVWYYPVWLDQ